MIRVSEAAPSAPRLCMGLHLPDCYGEGLMVLRATETAMMRLMTMGVCCMVSGMLWALWDRFFQAHSLAEANVLLTRVREAGVVVHPWP
jgi:hypothetical protein